MGEDSFEVPSSYYIDISAGATKQFGHFEISDGIVYGRNSVITVYKSLDGHRNLPVENVVRVGSFKLSNVGGCNLEEFFRHIREGIEEILSPSE